MLFKLKMMLYNWLIEDSIVDLVTDNFKQNSRIDQLESQNNQLKRDLDLIKSVCNIGVDVHERSDSWAVVCINGNKDYVNFVRLGSEDAREVKYFLKRFEKSNIRIDAPFPVDYLKW